MDAFLVKTLGRKTWERHDDRLRKMADSPETQGIERGYHKLQKLSREARYNGTPFIASDVDNYVAPLYVAVRWAMRTGLGLPV